MKIAERTVASLLGSYLAAALVLLFMWSVLLPGDGVWEVSRGAGGLFDTDFPSRWHDGLPGWTHAMVLLHTAGDLLTFLAYWSISYVFFAYHPVVRDAKPSRATMLAVTILFVSSALTHLLAAYTNFYPVYRLFGMVKFGSGLVGVAASVLIAWSLVRANAIWSQQRQELESQYRKRAAAISERTSAVS